MTRNCFICHDVQGTATIRWRRRYYHVEGTGIGWYVEHDFYLCQPHANELLQQRAGLQHSRLPISAIELEALSGGD